LGLAAGHILPAAADRLLRALGDAIHPRRPCDQDHLLRHRRAIFYPHRRILPRRHSVRRCRRRRPGDREVSPPLENRKSNEVTKAGNNAASTTGLRNRRRATTHTRGSGPKRSSPSTISSVGAERARLTPTLFA